jgi:hypothetical protein
MGVMWGCSGSTFRPKATTQGTALASQLDAESVIAAKTPRTPTRVELVAVHDVQNRIRFEVAVIPAQDKIARAYFRGPYVGPCEDLPGTEGAVGQDSSGHWMLQFSTDNPARQVMDDGAFLDVWLEPSEQCARIPVSGYAVGYEHVSDALSFVTGFRLNLAEPPVSDTVGMLSFPIGIAGWFGDFRAQLSTGLGTASCSKELCGTTGKDQALRFGWFFPMTTEIGYIDNWNNAGKPGAPYFGLYIGARYGAALSLLPAISGDTERRTLHMAATVIGMSWFAPQPATFHSVAARAGSLEFSIPIGVAFSGLGNGEDLSFMTGIEMTTLIPM